MIRDALTDIITWPWLGPVALALSALAVLVIVVLELRRPITDVDRYCAAVDLDLDDRTAGARRGRHLEEFRRRQAAARAAADTDYAIAWTWPGDDPPHAPHGDPEFMPVRRTR